MTTAAQTKRVKSLGHVRSAPPEMLANVGRDCYLKLVPGMDNPHKVMVDGFEVAPEWKPTGKTIKLDRRSTMVDVTPTNMPRLFRVEGLQRDYKGEICYTIYTYGSGATRCAGKDDVIFVKPLSDSTT